MENIITKCPICEFNDSEFVIATPVQMQNSDKLYSFHKCLNCEIIFLNNPPNNEEMSKYYNSDYLPYLGEYSWGKYKKFVKMGQNRIDQKKVKLALKVFKNIDINYNVLDFGCGSPTFLKKLNQKTNANCIGFDINSHGWLNKNEEYTKIELISGSLSKIEFNKKINLVTLWHSLEHDFNPKDLILLLNKITADNALLIIEVPNYNSFTRWTQKKYWGGFHTPRHSVVYTNETIKKMIENLGWTLEKKYQYGTMDSFTLWWLGHFEKMRAQKNKNEIKIEQYFWNYLILKILLFPFFMLERFFSFGIMTAVFRKKNNWIKNET